MNFTELQFGSQIAPLPPASAPMGGSPPGAPLTLADMLTRWSTTKPREFRMLKTVCARLCELLGSAPEDITIDQVERSRKDFRPFLVARKYKENTIRGYVNHVRVLLRDARLAGWIQGSSMSVEWRNIVALCAKERCEDIARSIAAIRQDPGDVSAQDADRWIKAATEDGLGYDSAVRKRAKFWRILQNQGFAPAAHPRMAKKRYGIQLKDFPQSFKTEIDELLRWKLKSYAWDRPKGAKHRPPTARRLKSLICRLYGFATNILRISGIECLTDLTRRDIVGPFAEWCLTERQTQGESLKRDLRLLAAVFNQHPLYDGIDMKWLKLLMDGLPVESQGSQQQRRAGKCVPYAAVEAIPSRLHAMRPALAKKGKRRLARLVMEELMMTWLLKQPWRQRNLRECRIGGTSPNLFKAPVPEITTIDLPEWALIARTENPSTPFWQFKFSEEETKTGCSVHSLLPHQLIEPLQEYLEDHRQHLIRGRDPGTLFLNEDGGEMSQSSVIAVVAKHTSKFTGRRVTPHRYRDIVAFIWLKEKPKCYMELSKLFWHSTPNEVIRTYGSLFNEPSGVVSMENWLDEREAHKQQKL